MQNEAVYETACKFFEKKLAKSQVAQDYVRKRGLSSETCRNYRLGYAPPRADGEFVAHLLKQHKTYDVIKSGLCRTDDIELASHFSNGIIFPIMFDDKIVSYTSRSINPQAFTRHKHLSGRMDYIYNEFLLELPIIVVAESPIDALSIGQAGYPAVATFGTSNLRFAPKFKQQKIVYIAFDNDNKKDKSNPGLEYAIKLGYEIKQLGVNVFIIEFPLMGLDKVDANVYLGGMDAPAKAFSELVRQSRAVNEYPLYWHIDRSKHATVNRKVRHKHYSTTLEQLKSTPIENVVVGRGGQIHYSNEKIAYCKCPFHEDDNPSMTLYLDTNCFMCRGAGCGKHGDVIQFVQYTDGVSFTEACRRLKEEYYG